MSRVTPFLWFNDQADSAARLYTAVIPNSAITATMPAGPADASRVMMVSFHLDGQPFMALNGGPHYALNPAYSMFVSCDTQDEVDRYWQMLGDGGEEQRCGWLKDRYGLSWQIVPKQLGELMRGPDAAAAKRVVDAMLAMRKIIIADLQRAYDSA